MYTGDCPLDPGYLELADPEPQAEGDHVCTVHPDAILETDEEAVIELDLPGFGLWLESRAPICFVNGSLRMFTADQRYRALTDGLYIFEGEFHESTDRVGYHVLRQDT